jgi:hypothetical protein
LLCCARQSTRLLRCACNDSPLDFFNRPRSTGQAGASAEHGSFESGARCAEHTSGLLTCDCSPCRCKRAYTGNVWVVRCVLRMKSPKHRASDLHRLNYGVRPN